MNNEQIKVIENDLDHMINEIRKVQSNNFIENKEVGLLLIRLENICQRDLRVIGRMK